MDDTSSNNRYNADRAASTIRVVTKEDCPLSCPMPNQDLWDAHPRVYLAIEVEKEVICPYCGIQYILKDKE